MQRKKVSIDCSENGFTLIELMVVIVILSVLAVWVAPKIMAGRIRPNR